VQLSLYRSVGTHLRLEFNTRPWQTIQNPNGLIGLRLIKIFGETTDTSRPLVERSLIDKTLLELNVPMYAYYWLNAKAILQQRDGNRPDSADSDLSYQSGQTMREILTSPATKSNLLLQSEFGSISWQRFGSEITEL
jgi:hypothetical protein